VEKLEPMPVIWETATASRPSNLSNHHEFNLSYIFGKMVGLAVTVHCFILSNTYRVTWQEADLRSGTIGISPLLYIEEADLRPENQSLEHRLFWGGGPAVQNDRNEATSVLSHALKLPMDSPVSE
jgi:hypothetical protein